jgi:general secretion pathway protein I
LFYAVKQDAGITLLELVLAIFILTLGSVAALRSVNTAGRGIVQEMDRILATQIALNTLEELQLIGPTLDVATTSKMGGRNWSIETRRSTTQAGLTSIEVHVASESGPGAHFTSFIGQGASQ